MIECDPITGACLLPEQAISTADTAVIKGSGWAVHYVGDPMCSWCWGISPTVSAVAQFCTEQGGDFTLIMGGLRAGGGDLWNAAFKSFLRNEWQHIAQTTGQPFDYTLLELPEFNYDTEPACRSVVTFKLLQANDPSIKSSVLDFLAAVQHKFYALGQDPRSIDFYASICANLGLDFAVFSATFNSPKTLQAVEQEFTLCRQLGVRSFPTLLLTRNEQTTPLAVGYVTAEQALARLQHELDT